MQVSEDVEFIDGVEMNRISSVDEMDPFLMTIVSNSDLWMFVSSTGGLTAGRVDAEQCIFPYETDDRLHHLAGRVGPTTLLRVQRRDAVTVWQPFVGRRTPEVERNLFKSSLGNAVVFEERHHALGLDVRARWAPSDRFGWVRTVSLAHRAHGEPMTVEIVDGLLEVMPWGVGVLFQQRRSNLANAYRRSEIVEPGVGVFSLEARIVDLPEPAEALRATTVWSAGLDEPLRSVDPSVLDATRRGEPFEETTLRTGRPGSFLVGATRLIDPGATVRWHVVTDAAQSHAAIADVAALLRTDDDVVQQIDDDIDRCAEDLRRTVAGADGMQSTRSSTMDTHHVANTLFNVMRGGTFAEGYRIDADRFRTFVRDRHTDAAEQHADWLAALPTSLDITDLRASAAERADSNLSRLAHEYLPLSFSRRHGDPSRPWNQFAIRVRDSDGQALLSYEGNWRDIFQNWEALCRSFPSYLPSIIAKFLNASTAEGFNPYRITSDGIDWEIPDPDDPWSGIGYWGDHQIVYLHRLLLAQRAHDPSWLRDELSQRAYAFAEVPYRIAPFEQLVADPKNTVDYDESAEAEIAVRVSRLGSDGRLLPDARGEIVHVTLLEKLLVPALTKLSNFVPRGGIWMNTQRPEWNDANNALVGHGLSMVTLSHLRRYLEFVDDVVREVADGPTDDGTAEHLISTDVARWLDDVTHVLVTHEPLIDAPTIGDRARFDVLRGLGESFDRYRTQLRERGPSEPTSVSLSAVRDCLAIAIRHLDDSLRASLRPDGLYDAYNLVAFHDDEDRRAASVSRLAPMLEGQVAAISSGLLGVDEVIELVEQMYDSELYRSDQHSFMLYPAHIRPSFLERNRIPVDAVESNPLLSALARAGDDRIISRDVDGHFHFHADFANANDLTIALDELTQGEFAPLVAEHAGATVDVFEQVFRHHRFTGRSSTMYAYEGVGSIYWHMVAKLLLAVQETILSAPAETDESTSRRICALYDRIRGGLGFNKTATEYGAFPTDPYSHTPAHAGAQQPGMTGQVKEELLARWAELGIVVEGGAIRVTTDLLHTDEFRTTAGSLASVDVDGRDLLIEVPADAIGLTLCSVPVLVHRGESAAAMTVTFADGGRREMPGHELDVATSRQIFERRGEVSRLDVSVPSEATRR